MKSVGRTTFFFFVGATIIASHIIGFTSSGLYFAWRLFFQLLALGLLFVALFLLPRMVRVSENYWKDDPAVRLWILIFVVTGTVETLINQALYGIFGFDLISKYLDIGNKGDLTMERWRFGNLLGFTCLALVMGPFLITGLREGFKGTTRD